MVFGATFGFANAVTFFAYAASFRFGGYLVALGEMEFQNVFRYVIKTFVYRKR